MVFSSAVFLLLFLPLLVFVYYSPPVRKRKLQNPVLLLASLVFYAWGEPVFLFLMLFSILVSWAAGLVIGGSHSKKTKKIWMIAGVAYHVAVLFTFKYLSFLAGQIGLLLHRESPIHLALPIGISFFTFQMISYLLDVYRGTAEAQRSLADVALYAMLFPQLIAGPIVRYGGIAQEIHGRTTTREGFSEGMRRFLYGLGKKVLLANYLAQIADNVFDYMPQRSVMTAWLGAFAYSLQFYFDFSGYSDMAIGLGRLFGFHFPENFRYPYAARSVTEFWRRWHMSLTSWFRDYVYIPLGGNRVSRPKWIRNMLIVWLLTGIWHGANWTFLLWGMVYFVVLVLEKTTNYPNRIGRLAYPATLLVVMIANILFRASDLHSAFVYIGNLLGIGVRGLADESFWYYLNCGKVVWLPAALLAFPVYPYCRERFQGRLFWQALESAVLVTVFAVSLLVTIGTTYNPFIYFHF